MSAISIDPHFMGLATRRVAWLVECVFEPPTAFQRYLLFHVTGRPAPDWLVLGPRRQCDANGGRQRLSRVAANDDTVHRAEGDVVDLVGIPVPIERVWFVQGDALTDSFLPNPRECLHCGITTANIAATLGPRDVARAAALLVDDAAGRGEHDPVHLCRYISAALFGQVTRYPLDRPDTSAPLRRGPS